MNTEKIKGILLAALATSLVVATVLGSAVVLKQLGVLKQPTVITISGSGKESYTPDKAEITLSVITKDKDSGVAQSKNDEKMAKIVNYLKDSGVKEEDIQTTSYNLYPEYEQGKGLEPSSPEYYYPNTFKIIGYTLDQGLSFKIKDLSKVGTIIGGLSDKGISQIGGVYFSLSDEKMEELKTKAKEKAVAKAQIELEKTKNLYGFKKSKLISINDYPVYPMPIYRGVDDLKVSSTPANEASIQVGEGELEVQVSLVYELR
ncbi:MAG: hypothetical protein A2418_02575 [Candidatus Brennerbacteria bacterium RIFOXYC1_FULL_41_11]|uniref:SIMPL domain-containing protein n=1 Tax=Candidatus Brennerbacteria bacterium RIFOXYD1_FULL_41_16 TaxID=1797529 RepID=A0A1G1XJT7_9BACT|nr:MAG: hypothetical protein A2391_02330 [Candidatus Brennerbacteria bacterium RIFOXYB1_FULL_41_13]OGY39068.1 MAG: hypothetical protein A2418_02575 [Candidatus Brennerbacteria bacterium RIFOXYC1_FULL_41_11]OGY40221.1 MAG: hypothetical protein A2570_02955 [Candidatus Brennerbacteria bacterium RIFOXYD1_FULL_41_16]